jgi:hypothetical protein
MPTVEDAEELARELLKPLVNRWAHVQAVAARAHDLQIAAGGESDRQLLVAAAWWYDLGYAPALRDTGCHHIDGARFLITVGYPERLCALVAHYSAATCEAEERGLRTELTAWPREDCAWPRVGRSGRGLYGSTSRASSPLPDRVAGVGHHLGPRR